MLPEGRRHYTYQFSYICINRFIMSKRCLNCGHSVNLKFCPQCGQSSGVGRLNWKSFITEFMYVLTHAESKVWGTAWQLIKNPGRMMDEYFAGKRKKYQSPVAFFLIWVSISILTHRAIIAHSGFHPVYMPGITFSNPESIKVFIVHGEWMYILAFPVSAALLYYIVAWPVYNYIECIVIVMLTFSGTYLFFTLCYVVGGFIFSLNVLHWQFYLFQILLSVAYSVWVCITLFRHKHIRLLGVRLIAYLAINAVVVLRFLEILSNIWAGAEGKLE